MKEMRVQVETLVQSNPLLLARIEAAKREEEEAQEGQSGCDDESSTVGDHKGVISADVDEPSFCKSHPVHFDFEDTLHKSPVYTRTAMDTTSSILSFHTSRTHWTRHSRLSLEQNPNTATIFLPICQADLPSSYSQWSDLEAPEPCETSVAADLVVKAHLHQDSKAQQSAKRQNDIKTPLEERECMDAPGLLSKIATGTRGTTSYDITQMTSDSGEAVSSFLAIETKVNTSGDRHTRQQMPHIIVGIDMGYLDTCKKAPAFAVSLCA